MSYFKVIWEIDVEAETPAAAALEVARAHFQDRIAKGLTGTACCFDVIEVGTGLPPFVIDLSVAAQGLTAPELQELYGMAGHPRYHWQFWRDAVSNQETTAGYWEWVHDKLTAESRKREARKHER